MKSFNFLNPGSIYEVIDCLTKNGESARMLAGGTDLVMAMKLGIREPEYILNLNSIRGLNHIRVEDGQLKIGATALLSEIESSPLVKDNYPALSRAAHLVASVQIRNMGTIGGNLCQDVQCLYFRNPIFNCYRKGGEQCFAFDGENKYGAIFVVPESEKCWAGFPSDLGPMLIALNAKVKIVGPVGDRTVNLEDFYSELGNCLQIGEILTEVQIPKQSQGYGSEYLKLRLAKGMGFPLASAAVVLAQEDGKCSYVKIALGGVAPMPWRARKAEEVLLGNSIDENTAKAAAAALLETAKPLKKSAYKEPMLKALLERAILSAGEVGKK